MPLDEGDTDGDNWREPGWKPAGSAQMYRIETSSLSELGFHRLSSTIAPLGHVSRYPPGGINAFGQHSSSGNWSHHSHNSARLSIWIEGELGKSCRST